MLIRTLCVFPLDHCNGAVAVLIAKASEMRVLRMSPAWPIKPDRAIIDHKNNAANIDLYLIIAHVDASDPLTVRYVGIHSQSVPMSCLDTQLRCRQIKRILELAE